MSIQEAVKDVCERNNGRLYTRTLAAQMRIYPWFRSTTTGNLNRAYYQIKKAEAAGFLFKSDGVWKLTESGKAWCGLEGRR